MCRKYIDDAANKFDKKRENQADMGELSVLEKMFLRSGENRDIPTIMAMDAMMAGVDTTGGAATFLLYHLASNEEKQELLYKEICDHIGPSTSDIITESKIKKMKYLRACAQESHRLRPVAVGVGRRTQVPMVLSNYHVPKGVSVQYLAFVSSSCASQYDDPEVFRPERWLRGHECHHQVISVITSDHHHQDKNVRPMPSPTSPLVTGPGCASAGGLPSWSWEFW